LGHAVIPIKSYPNKKAPKGAFLLYRRQVYIQ